MKHIRIALLSLACVLATAQPAAALKISPFKVTLLQGSDRATQVFRVENNSPEPAAVQVSALTWEIRPDGREINADAEKDFVIFPAQIVLGPHESKSVRVQWVGDNKTGSEIPYRILAEQIPIDLKSTPEAGSALRFLLRFLAALYITPPDAKADIRVEKTAIPADKPGVVRVFVANHGTAHAVMRKPVLQLALSDGRRLRLDGDALKPLAGENLHAGMARYFDIALPPGVNTYIASATLDFESGF